MNSARFMELNSLSAFNAHFGHNVIELSMSLAPAIHLALADLGSYCLTGLSIFVHGSPSSLLGFPLTIVFVWGAVGVALWLGLRKSDWSFVLGLAGLTAVVFLVTVLSRTTSIPIFRAFRWDTLYLTAVPIVAVLWGKAVDQAAGSGRWWRGRLIPEAIFALATIIGMASMATRSLELIQAYGGWAALSDYTVLHDVARDNPLIRAASLPRYYPKAIVGPFNGLEVLDGMRQNFTWRRTAFWFLTLKSPARSAWHTHRQMLGRKIDDVNISALLMANTGLLLSTSATWSKYFRQIAKQSALHLRDARAPFMRLLSVALPRFTLLPPIHVYWIGVPWPRVFVARQRIEAGVADDTVSYFLQLRSLPRLSVLVPENAPAWLTRAAGGGGGPTVRTVQETRHGIVVNTDGAPGVLVYNQEYTRKWKAYCAGDVLEVTPVNGLMMAVSVPQGCRKITFLYDSFQRAAQ